MDFSKLPHKPTDILKLVGLLLIVLVVLSFLFRLFGGNRLTPNFLSGSESAGSPGATSYAYDMAQTSGKMLGDGYATGMPQLSTRNIAPPTTPTPGGGTTGNQAEDFEVKDYSGSIETRDLPGTCGAIAGLKAKTYVIFEQATQSDRDCNYTFKVERSHLAEIRAFVEGLDPRDLSENTQTIKRTVDDFTSEIEILQAKRTTIEKTLSDATSAYDELTTLATRSGDVSTLAKIIDSKLTIIERLTQERINVNEQLDRLSRSKADQLDRVDYVYFRLNVYENKFVDGQALKDSWKESVRGFINDVNRVFQDLTVGLLGAAFIALQWVIYFFLALVIVKYLWKFAKAIWKS